MKTTLKLTLIVLALTMFMSSCSTSSCAFGNSNYVKTYNMCPAYH
jgi:PBP1b-binding outer membrane lipoprotein LpoB